MIDDAGCMAQCIPPGKHDSIQTYLLALINDGSMDPSTLMQEAVQFNKVPPGMQTALQVYLLCQILGNDNCTPEQLAFAAKCYKCIPKGLQKVVQTYLQCQWANNLTPVPPSCQFLLNLQMLKLVG